MQVTQGSGAVEEDKFINTITITVVRKHVHWNSCSLTMELTRAFVHQACYEAAVQQVAVSDGSA